MASKWADIQKDKELFPQLEFDAIIDGRTSSQCRNFNGKVYDVNDPIWNIIFPPNHWGCRSTVRKVRGRKSDSSASLDTSSVKDGFRTNMAKDGMPWPKDKGYYETQGLGYTYEDVKKRMGDAAYKYVDRPGKKGMVFESGINIKKPVDLAENIKEAQRRYTAADAMANELNTTFFITPEIKYLDKRYPYYFKDANSKKSPDLFGDNEYWDVGIYGTKVFKKSGKQADNIVIILDSSHDVEAAKKEVSTQLLGKSNFAEKTKQVFIVTPDGIAHKIK